MEADGTGTDWQSVAAIGVVALTLAVVVFRLVRRARKRGGGCGKCELGDCKEP